MGRIQPAQFSQLRGRHLGPGSGESADKARRTQLAFVNFIGRSRAKENEQWASFALSALRFEPPASIATRREPKSQFEEANKERPIYNMKELS